WPKRRILAEYVNNTYYGHHAYGAQAAATTYFSTSARRLTLAQAALLAGLPQAPTLYDPFRRPEAAVARRNEVLRALGQAGYVSLARAQAAEAQPLGLKPGRLYTQIDQPNFFGYVQQQLGARYGAKAVAGGGLRVRSTLDPKLQLAAQQILKDTLHEKTDP